LPEVALTVFPARQALPAPRTLPPASVTPRPPVSTPPTLDVVRPGPVEWARRRRAEREARRVEAAGTRALNQLDHLGPSWHVIDWPRTDLPDARLSGLDRSVHDERAGFLAIGPNGLFAITIADHGRARVLVSGDVVQINGKRPAYIAQTRRDARRASKALSAAVGLTVPIAPVLTFVGSGHISVYGLPKECLVTTHRELDRLLLAGGSRISPATAGKLSEIARQPTTWLSAAYRSTANYRWYEEGRTAADKRPTRR
jgi:hypothetical protein